MVFSDCVSYGLGHFYTAKLREDIMVDYFMTKEACILLASYVGALLIYYRVDWEKEDKHFLKVFGYLMLGMFYLGYNNIYIPGGFIVICLGLRPKTNRKAKYMSAFLGLAVFVLIRCL